MEVVVLKAGLFPDAATVERALARLPNPSGGCTQWVFDVSQPDGGANEEHWDRVLDRLLRADRIVVI